MDAWLHATIESFAAHAGWLGAYAAVAGVLLLSGLGLPIPEDIPLLIGGWMCGMGYANIWVMVPLGFVCVLGADLLVFLMGRVYGHHVPRLPVIRRYLTPARLAAAERSFQKHGGKTLFVARFLPGVRSAIYFTAGTFKISTWKMLAFDGLAALLSAPALVLVGYFGTRHFDKVKAFVEGTQWAIAAVAILATAAFIVWRLRKRRALPAAPSAGA